jgi:phage/plasmid-associated DNA primase
MLADASDLIGFVQRFFGYCLTGCTNEQKFSFFYGTGVWEINCDGDNPTDDG